MSQHFSAMPPGPDLRNEIGALTPSVVLVRVFPASRAVTHFFMSDFCRLFVNQDVERQVTRLIRHAFAQVADWRWAHDFHVPSGNLYLTPEPYQKGYVPEDDCSFGMSAHRLIAAPSGGSR